MDTYSAPHGLLARIYLLPTMPSYVMLLAHSNDAELRAQAVEYSFNVVRIAFIILLSGDFSIFFHVFVRFFNFFSGLVFHG